MGGELIQIREYDHELDWEMVRGWWAGRGQAAVEECMLTSYGIVAVAGEVALACAWLYVNNRSEIARVENMVTNPAEPERGPEGLAYILEFFEREATNLGKACEVDRPFADTSFAPALARGHEFIDRCELEMAKYEGADMPLTHRFTPGMYIRQIFIPARTLLTSKIHKTEHPYVISQGDISVWTKEGGAVRLRAPHTGITKPGTRRILFAHEDTIWTTFHATDETDVEKIEEAVLEKRVNPLIEARLAELMGS